MKKVIFGIIILALVIAGFAIMSNRLETPTEDPSGQVTTIYGAVGGGKENFLADTEIAQILLEEYNLEVKNTTLSNSRLNVKDLPEQEGNFDFMFPSDIRYYIDYQNNGSLATKYKPRDGYIVLNTPVVLYSWETIAEALISEGIVTKTDDGIYYVTDMPKLLEYQTQQKKWSDIGLEYTTPIRIESVDPLSSTPGETYYGLIASTLHGGDINEGDVSGTMKKLKLFYESAGMMFNSPRDLFDLYTRMGPESKPLIEDYEKSLLDFACGDPEAYASLKELKNGKDRMVILYPNPTILNSHCVISFTEAGDRYVDAMRNNKRIQEIAFSRYGFRTGLTDNVNNFVTADGEKVPITGVPAMQPPTMPGLKIESYSTIKEALR